MKRRKQPAPITPWMDWTAIDCTVLVAYVHEHIARRQRPTAAIFAAVQGYNAAQLAKAHNQLQNELTQHGVNGDWLDCVFYALAEAVGIDNKTTEYNCPRRRWMAA